MRGKKTPFDSKRHTGVKLGVAAKFNAKSKYQKFASLTKTYQTEAQKYSTAKEAFEKTHDAEFMLCLLEKLSPKVQQHSHQLHQFAWHQIEMIDVYIPHPMGDQLFGTLHNYMFNPTQPDREIQTLNYIQTMMPSVLSLVQQAAQEAGIEGEVKKEVAAAIASLFYAPHPRYEISDCLSTYKKLDRAFELVDKLDKTQDERSEFQRRFRRELRRVIDTPFE